MTHCFFQWGWKWPLPVLLSSTLGLLVRHDRSPLQWGNQCQPGFCTLHGGAGSLGQMNQETEGDVTFQERLGSNEESWGILLSDG